ncbi:MAG: hypothetical protein HUK24_02205 [Sphaerochaetaceae bacterium]|nr:hypothetical protein [Sphaerochaetaceae bacterium]
MSNCTEKEFIDFIEVLKCFFPECGNYKIDINYDYASTCFRMNKLYALVNNIYFCMVSGCSCDKYKEAIVKYAINKCIIEKKDLDGLNFDLQLELILEAVEAEAIKL